MEADLLFRWKIQQSVEWNLINTVPLGSLQSLAIYSTPTHFLHEGHLVRASEEIPERIPEDKLNIEKYIFLDMILVLNRKQQWFPL